MKNRGILVVALAVVPALSAAARAATQDGNPPVTPRAPGLERMRDDLLDALANAELDEARIQELERSVATLKDLRGARERGEPIDLVAANRALRPLKEVLRSNALRPEDRRRLQETSPRSYRPPPPRRAAPAGRWAATCCGRWCEAT